MKSLWFRINLIILYQRTQAIPPPNSSGFLVEFDEFYAGS